MKTFVESAYSPKQETSPCGPSPRPRRPVLLGLGCVLVVVAFLGLPLAKQGGTLIADEANQWSYSGLNGYTVFSLAAHPSRPHLLYAATEGGGVSHSNNNGEQWDILNQGLSNLDTTAVTVGGNGTVYVGTWGDGVAMYPMGATRWTSWNECLDDDFIFALAVDGTGTVYAGSYGGGIYTRTPQSPCWTRREIGNPFILIIKAAPDGHTVYAGTEGGVFQSTDSGASWHLLGLDTRKVYGIGVSKSNSVYAGTDQGVYKSTSGVGSWQPCSNELPPGKRIYSLAVDNQSWVYAGINEGGVFRSVDGCSSWENISAGLGNQNVLYLLMNVTDAQQLFAGTSNGVWLHNITPPTPEVSISLSNDPRGAVMPGDNIQYTIYYTNTTGVPVREVVITNTIPIGTRWVPGCVGAVPWRSGRKEGNRMIWDIGSLRPGQFGLAYYCVMVVAHTPTPSPSPTPTMTSTPTFTSTPTPTHTPVATPTETITLTPMGAETSTPTPTLTVTPTITTTPSASPMSTNMPISSPLSRPTLDAPRPTDIEANEEYVIWNEGAWVTWIYQGERGWRRSNRTRNPPLQVFVPLILK